VSLNRYAKRRDDNEAEIIDALKAIGCTVTQIDQPVDLIVGYRTYNFLIEVKDGSKPPSRRQKTDSQKQFFKTWRGQVRVVETPEEAIELVTHAYKSPQTGSR
jgi:hypothetical protein